jgi:protein phosphatase PTC1
VRLSYDHKASSPTEAERIKADGGWVVMNKVAGILSVSRAFGNEELKQWVLADPYISETELTPEDTHLIIACDGV